MPKQEQPIIEFHGGTNKKADARDIADNQNEHCSMSIYNVGKLKMEGDFKNIYNEVNGSGNYSHPVTADTITQGYGLFNFSHDYGLGKYTTYSKGLTTFTDATCDYNNDPTVACNSNANIRIGQKVSGTGIPSGAYVTQVDTPGAVTEFELSASTTGGSVTDGTLTFTPTNDYNSSFNDFILVNDQSDIDILEVKDDGDFIDGVISLGSRKGVQSAYSSKPIAYYADGALRMDDRNRTYAQNTSVDVESASMASTSFLGGDEAKLLTTMIVHDTVANISIPGTLIRIAGSEEIIMVLGFATGEAGGTADNTYALRVIRGVAGSIAENHDDESSIYYRNVPKWFSHVKKQVFKETSFPESLDVWTENFQCPQRPNNTSFSTVPGATVDGKYAHSSSGLEAQAPFMEETNEKALTLIDGWNSDKSYNYPLHSEKVRMIYKEGNSKFIGIKKFTNYGNEIEATCYSDPRNVFQEGQDIDITNVIPDAWPYEGRHTIKSLTATTIRFMVTTTEDSGEVSFGGSANTATYHTFGITGLADYTETDGIPSSFQSGAVSFEWDHTSTGGDIANTLNDVAENAGDVFYCYITGTTGADYDGVHKAVRIDDHTCYIAWDLTTIGEDEDGGFARLSAGTVSKVVGTAAAIGQGAIDDTIARKWMFGISWTYDGPKLERQESRITKGWKTTDEELVTDNGAASPGLTGQGINYWGLHHASDAGYWAANADNWSHSSVGSEDVTSATTSGFKISADNILPTSSDAFNSAAKFVVHSADSYATIDLGGTATLGAALTAGNTYRLRCKAMVRDAGTGDGQMSFRLAADSDLIDASGDGNWVEVARLSDHADCLNIWKTIDVTFKYSADTRYFGIRNRSDSGHGQSIYIAALSVVEETEMSDSVVADFMGYSHAPTINLLFKHKNSSYRWNERISGFKIYGKDVTGGEEGDEWRLFAVIDFEAGTYRLPCGTNVAKALIKDTNGNVSINLNEAMYVRPVETYETENFYTEDTEIMADYSHATIAGKRAYVAGVRQNGKTNQDRMIRSPLFKYDIFPETNFIDVAIGDGDRITHLESYGDRILQFKKKNVYVINTQGEEEFLETTFPYIGVDYPSQVCKTNSGICWITESGLYLFTGEEILRLTEFVVSDAFDIGSGSNSRPLIAYEPNTNRIIFTPKGDDDIDTKWYIWDLNAQAMQGYHRGNLFPYDNHDGQDNAYTNIVTMSNGELVVAHIGQEDTDALRLWKWDSSVTGNENPGYLDNYANHSDNVLWLSKDIDFGSPSIRKKIHKVNITYQCVSHTGVRVQYSTNGGKAWKDFSTTTSTYYENKILSMTEGWVQAELKPETSINNVKSIQIRLVPYQGDYIASTLNAIHSTLVSGIAQGGTNTEVTLQTNANASSLAADALDNYNIGIYGGNGRYNVSKISNVTGNPAVITRVSGSDKGYGANAANGSDYNIGVIPPDFEINDISIIFRPKSVK